MRNFPIRLERSSSFPFFSSLRQFAGQTMAAAWHAGRDPSSFFVLHEFSPFLRERESSESVHFSGQRHLVHFFLLCVPPLFLSPFSLWVGCWPLFSSPPSPPPLCCQYNVSTCKWIPPLSQNRRATSDPLRY